MPTKYYSFVVGIAILLLSYQLEKLTITQEKEELYNNEVSQLLEKEWTQDNVVLSNNKPWIIYSNLQIYYSTTIDLNGMLVSFVY